MSTWSIKAKSYTTKASYLISSPVLNIKVIFFFSPNSSTSQGRSRGLVAEVKTLVFSADAADEKLYSELRVNGNLKKVLKNVETFQNIREKKYPNNSIITRVSGVKFNDKQNFDEMIKLWSGLVDQVAFVDYNPWENSYEKPSNNIEEACSDLWRRMFIWWDGKINPCDVDYKSLLSVGNIKDNNISELWLSKKYNKYREEHLNSKRKNIKPCHSCTVV